MRVYLVVIDESEEAGVALRFASRRAAITGGAVHLLALAPPEPFQAFPGIQATIEEEARQRAGQLAANAVNALTGQAGPPPVIAVEVGDGPKVVLDYLAAHEDVAALVLAAAREGPPGPLVSHFAGHAAGALPCPLYIIPGGLSDEAVDRLS